MDYFDGLFCFHNYLLNKNGSEVLVIDNENIAPLVYLGGLAFSFAPPFPLEKSTSISNS